MQISFSNYYINHYSRIIFSRVRLPKCYLHFLINVFKKMQLFFFCDTFYKFLAFFLNMKFIDTITQQFS